MIYLLLFICFCIAIAVFSHCHKLNIIDKPNERSSHSRITLRGGGIVFWISVLIYFCMSGFANPWFFAGLTLISAISFADDITPQSPNCVLVVQFVALMLMCVQWQLFDYSWFFVVLALIVGVGVMNAFNFMDGINGITGGYSMAVVGSFWYINNFEQEFVDNDLIYLVIMSLLVFNFINFRKKAKCFAGDVGAISIAFIIVFLLGLLIVKTGDFSYIVLLLVYGVDSVLTIMHRIILKENITQPHVNICISCWPMN
jgi:UDP-N-acetylmuramyl pentapeptide phosphotransferase/UDP-N-acetylglucosamine-1-phosphate transferase